MPPPPCDTTSPSDIRGPWWRLGELTGEGGAQAAVGSVRVIGGAALDAQVGQGFRLEGGPGARGGLGALLLQRVVKHGQDIAALAVVILQRLGEGRQLTDLLHLAVKRRTTASAAPPSSGQHAMSPSSASGTETHS